MPSKTSTARATRRGVAAITLSILAAGTLAACGSSGADADQTTSSGGNASGTQTADQGSSQQEIVITCASCQQGEDLFLQYNYDTAQRFNEANKGKYRVETVDNQNAGSGPERLSYYQRLALAGDLPDVFLLDKQETKTLSQSADLVDFSAALNADPTWRDSYYPDALGDLSFDGKQLGLPEVRDVVGIYANEKILHDAGVTEFPKTWDDLDAACEAVEASGETCLAMDGNWVTLLMWTNLIGTSPDANDFLAGRIGNLDWAADDAVVAATERLLSWQTKGYANEDSVAGDYANAATVFQTGHAAMIANGPWMLGDIKGESSAPGLADNVSYNASPGWSADQRGVITIIGGSWVSGSTDPAKQEAAAAFFKFLVSGDEPYAQTIATGSYPPVNAEPTAEQKGQLDPMIAGLVQASTDLPLHYPNATANAPATFGQAWLNLWPALVHGEMDTATFLSRLTHDAAAGS